LMAVASAGPSDFGAIGVLVQAANDLRDLEFDRSAGRTVPDGDAAARELHLCLRLAEYAPQAVAVLRLARFDARSRARAAVAFLAVTTAGFLIRRSGLTPWSLLRLPRIAAGLAYASQAVYERILFGLEQEIHRCIVGVCVGRADVDDVPSAASKRGLARLQSSFEARIAAAHPDPACASLLGHSAMLLRAALGLCSRLPVVPIGQASRLKPAAAILLVSDYLIACVIDMFSRLGHEALMEAGGSMAALIRASEHDGADGDSSGEIAALLGFLVGRARGLPIEAARARARKHQGVSVLLHRADRARGRASRRLGREAASVPLWGDDAALRRSLHAEPDCAPVQAGGGLDS